MGSSNFRVFGRCFYLPVLCFSCLTFGSFNSISEIGPAMLGPFFAGNEALWAWVEQFGTSFREKILIWFGEKSFDSRRLNCVEMSRRQELRTCVKPWKCVKEQNLSNEKEWKEGPLIRKLTFWGKTVKKRSEKMSRRGNCSLALDEANTKNSVFSIGI